MRHGYWETNHFPVPLMMSQVSGPAIKTQRNHHGNSECAAMAVVVVVGEGLQEAKCVCMSVLFNRIPVESAATQKSLQLQEEKGSTVPRFLTHTHFHTHIHRPSGCLLSQLTFTRATHSWPINHHVTSWGQNYSSVPRFHSLHIKPWRPIRQQEAKVVISCKTWLTYQKKRCCALKTQRTSGVRMAIKLLQCTPCHQSRKPKYMMTHNKL